MRPPRTNAERDLLAILIERALVRGAFGLAAGGGSNYYLDARAVSMSADAAHLIGDVLYERTRDLDIAAVGGLAVGAVPLTAAAVISYRLHGQKMEGFWVRDEVKTHGTRKRVAGNLCPGSRVVVVDDVITTGTSALRAVDAVRDHGCEVAAVVALVDRRRGAEDLFRGHGIETYRPVFTTRDFGIPDEDSPCDRP